MDITRTGGNTVNPRFALILPLILLAFCTLAAQGAGQGGPPPGMDTSQTTELVGIIKQVTEQAQQGGPAGGGGNDNRGQQPAQTKLYVIELHSGDSVIVGTKKYWKKLDVKFEAGKVIKFNVVPSREENTYMAVSLTYGDVEYDLLNEDGRPVWMEAPIQGGGPGGGGPGGGGGQPPNW